MLQSREEGTAVALVRVYCGLASAELRAQPAAAGAWLTVAVVDDAGRLLDVCEVSDDATGYARLGTLLAERSGGPTGVCIAADSDDHLVTMLLTAAGRPLAFADDDLVDDFAERFADDESMEEIESPAAVRRAIGLARALQAGVMSAVALPAPRDLAVLKPVLSAHSAIAVGRQAAAVALREVLRELYPAALRAYPDPAERVCLAVLDALPEPGRVSASGSGPAGSSGHAHGNGEPLETVAAALTAAGVADSRTVAEVITALRVAVAETPHRGAVSRSVTATAAETVRQAIAAVRAFDAAGGALIGALADRANPPVSRPRVNRLTAQPDVQAPVRASDRAPVRGPAAEPGQVRVPIPRRARPVSPAAGPVSAAPLPVRPVSSPPVPDYPAAHLAPPGPVSGVPAMRPVSGGPPMQPVSGVPAPATPVSGAPAAAYGRPVPPPPPGITPIPRRPMTSGPTRPTASRPASAPPASAPPAYGPPPRRPMATPVPEPAAAPLPPLPPPPAAEPAAAASWAGRAGAGFGITDYSPPMPARPSHDEPRWGGGDSGRAAEPAQPGSRANWPLVSSYGEAETPPAAGPDPLPERREGRVKPPWQSDDMPAEPPMLRLVEPPPLADPALRDPLTGGFGGELPTDVRLDPPPLRLVEGEGNGRSVPRGRRNTLVDRAPEPPAPDNDDNDLLIFAAARSAWFTGRSEDDVPSWETTSADYGWQAAEQAAEPSIGDSNTAGLPRRVPQANLVPGSPVQLDRPLRIVRDPGSIAEHTNGYFQGWRRGREIGGYAVGGRPGRDSAHGWDFSRDHDSGEYEQPQYEYRQAAYRS
ncbi:MAG TPA: transposase [Micromonosporaceae bacterium]|nr:transposase [Micromonosporaceae bacterium]